MFAEDISEDFSEDREYHFYTVFYSISGYLRNLRGRLLSSEKFSEVFTLWVFTLKPFPVKGTRRMGTKHRRNCWQFFADYFSYRLSPLINSVHSDRTPCKRSTLGRFLVNFCSLSVKTDQNPTENRLKKLTLPMIPTGVYP